MPVIIRAENPYSKKVETIRLNKVEDLHQFVKDLKNLYGVDGFDFML